MDLKKNGRGRGRWFVECIYSSFYLAMCLAIHLAKSLSIFLESEIHRYKIITK